jgi:hypothetical protein
MTADNKKAIPLHELDAQLGKPQPQELKSWYDHLFWFWNWYFVKSSWKWFLDNFFAILGLYVLLCFAAGRLLGSGWILHKPVLLVNVPHLKECFIAFLGLSSPNVVNIVKTIGEQIVNIISAMRDKPSK